MNSLRDLQTTCGQAFTGESSRLLALVRDNGVAPAQRVEVYRNNHREIFRKALAASYPVIERLVGDACFTGLAREYTRANPWRSGDLQRYGQDFSSFLKVSYGETQYRYLPDVASLEWALEEVHLDPDEPALSISEFGRFDETDYGNLVFVPRRAMRLLRSRYPVFSIWRANQSGSDDRVDLDQGGESVAIARQGHDLQVHRLDRAAFRLAAELARGTRLQDAWQPVDGASERDNNETAPDLASALQTILSLGLLAGVSAAGAQSATTDRGSQVWKQPSSI